MVSVAHFGIAFVFILGFSNAQLEFNFYKKTCPQAEKIVLDFVNKHIPNAPTLAASLLRMHFHDCFVQGCDGSVLLNFTSASGNQTEKQAPPNLTLGGFNIIDRIKILLEDECPGIVSCADVLALAARDAVVVTGGPSWKVPTGRRDGSISNAAEVMLDIPSFFDNLTTLRADFNRRGLDDKDLVVLSGAHTIGIAHCSSFTDRLYNFTGVGDQDPSLDSEYAENLKARKCKTSSDTNTIVEMDPGSFRTFDLSYYKLLMKRRGLFVSDATLLTSSSTRDHIIKILEGSLDDFFHEFALSMEKMGKIELKTGTQGEIRKNCAFVNS
ncbi:peroxidase 3 [Impatiens glandulifera]|uniref:peroxidase 3 n=1 Tax=Impatiens glandulifera TaxID=253017 RepID=UPI001FB17AF1|nr:peroxidase 3 [Impatiens glandulifera]